MVSHDVNGTPDIVSIFENRAGLQPEATALVSDTEVVSYRALNARANALANLLVRRGITQASRVALVLPRCTDAIVAMLAILKAGAVYVPIDPAYPSGRIAFMLRDSGAELVLTNAAIELTLPALPAPLLVLGTFTASLADVDLASLARSPAAYIMYTSGTTGQPKGALVPQSGVVRLVCGAKYLHVEANERILHHSTCAFDAATFEIWFGLLNGGTVVLAPAAAFALDRLERLVVAHGITTLLLTTALFHVVAAERPTALGPLRQLIIGGDVLDAKHVSSVLRQFSHLRIVNGYGPTENTTFTTCFVMTGETGVPDPVPIGKPIDGTLVRILDGEMNQVVDGVPGELYAGGLGLAYGYVNRPELTQERFVQDPLGLEGELLYRTGDRVVRLEDGNLRFLGRLDDQIKIDGFRVEPAEVQSVLISLAGVLDAVVLATRLATDAVRLVAYVRVSDGAITARIRDALAERLPRYLVPTIIVALDSFPMTLSGKIDREMLAALPLPTESDATDPSASSYLGVVLGAWREQLELPKLAKDAPLFDHGASSLTTMLVHAKLNALFHCNVDSLEVAGAPTSADWAEAYRRACEGRSDTNVQGTKVESGPHFESQNE